MGVWIETEETMAKVPKGKVTPCMGVWIETSIISAGRPVTQVTPCMGVWIETFWAMPKRSGVWSHPVWVCGLKRDLRAMKY